MAVKSVPSGIPQLDLILMDGVPRGSTLLVEGSTGSGKELFAKQFAAAGIGSENVVYFPTDESDEDLITTMKRFNWKTNLKSVNIFTQYYEKILVRELMANRYKQEGLSAREITKFRGSAIDREKVNFLNETVYEVSRVKPPFRVVIDSLDFFLTHYPYEEVLAAMQTIKAHVQYNKGLALFTLTSDAFDRKIQTSMEAVSDIVFEMEIMKMASTYENHLLVKKVRNYPEKAAILIYAITENGITPEQVARIA
jgi:KaiC/GvpD/RAD55 family RecA-like ATPase